MHDEIRNRDHITEMSLLVRNGLFWTKDVLHTYAKLHSIPVSPVISIVQFPDGWMVIRDGHHRCLATYIGGRSYLRHDEYIVEKYTYEMYLEINFQVGFITPFDPRKEVRIPDFSRFKQKVLELYTTNPELAIEFIKNNKSQYARSRIYENLSQMADSYSRRNVAWSY